MKEPKIKILISCHKPSDVVQNKLFLPIQVGASLKKTLDIPNIQADNKGDNISDLNPRFCELTAQYWAWKNLELDFYGFFHYRRYLSFHPELRSEVDAWGNIVAPFIDADFIAKFGLDPVTMQETINKYDIVLPDIKDITTMPKMGVTLREQFSIEQTLHQSDLEIMLDVIQEKYPDYLQDANEFLDGKLVYLNNIFIMRRELFQDYSAWLFDILFECDKRINYADYSNEAIRTPGHLAERLFNIYLIHLRRQDPNLRICHLPTIYVDQPEPLPAPHPAFPKHNVAIAFSANNYYIPYLATTLQSILDNSSSAHNYDILILHQDITIMNRNRLQRILSKYPNFSVRFINLGRFSAKFAALVPSLFGHFTLETWFRLLLPDLLPDYDKVLYLDSDLVVEADVADLYDTDLKGYLLAACHDADSAGLYNGYVPTKKHYIDHILKLKHPYDYFQAGVLVLNLAEFRKRFTTTELLEYAGSYRWELLDQDVLNHFAEGSVKYVDMAWNVMFDWRYIRIPLIISRAPKHLVDAYQSARQHPKIIHYAGPDKPWLDPSGDFAEVFWKYARETEYYEQIIFQTCHNITSLIPEPFPRRLKRRVKDAITYALPEHTRRGKVVRRLARAIRHR